MAMTSRPSFVYRNLLLVLLVAAAPFAASAAGTHEHLLTIQNRRFEPATLKAPADTKFKMLVTNEDSTPSEFESNEFNHEKIVPPNSTVTGFISSSLAMLLAVVALAVLREGSEIVLFLYGMAASGAGRVDLLAGVPLGLASGVAVGFALYLGLLRIPIRHFFTATNWMLVLQAAGLSSGAAGFLIQADWLPAWSSQLWNTSWLLGNGSLLGQTLHVLVGYEARPAGMQLVFWLVTALGLFTGMRWMAARMVSVSARSNSRQATTSVRTRAVDTT